MFNKKLLIHQDSVFSNRKVINLEAHFKLINYYISKKPKFNQRKKIKEFLRTFSFLHFIKDRYRQLK